MYTVFSLSPLCIPALHSYRVYLLKISRLIFWSERQLVCVCVCVCVCLCVCVSGRFSYLPITNSWKLSSLNSDVRNFREKTSSTGWKELLKIQESSFLSVIFFKCQWLETIYLIYFGCTVQLAVSWPGIKPVPPALGARSLNTWTTREVLRAHFQWPLIAPLFYEAVKTDASLLTYIIGWCVMGRSLSLVLHYKLFLCHF